jgi:hypothetical protein
LSDAGTLAFTLEPRDAIGIGDEGLRQDLYRDLAAQLRVAGAIDLSHPTRAEWGDHVVRPDSRARDKGHGRKSGAQILP